MPETNSKGQRLISVVRVIEYHGTDEWIRGVMQASRLPMQGVFNRGLDGKPLPEGCSIKSGLVVWNIEEPAQIEDRPPIPIPPGSTSIM